MLQREVVDRIAAAPGTGDYGRLTVMLAPWVRRGVAVRRGPGAFQPPPQVWSAVVRLTVRPRAGVRGEPAFRARVVAAAFSHRRKTLRNALRDVVTAEQIAACGVDPGARPETLAPDSFNELATLDRQCGRLEPRHPEPRSAAMSPIAAILLVLDLNEDSAAVGRRAQALAAALGAEVELLHVVEFVPVEPMGETLMPAVQIEERAAAARQAAPARHWPASSAFADAACHVEAGNVKSEIVRIARESHVDLIVLGSRERHGLSILVNLTEDTVLHAAPCDVLAVRVGPLTLVDRTAADRRRWLESTRRGNRLEHKIRVDVETSYVEDQSDPKERRFVFSYTITMRNEGQVPAQAPDAPLDHHGRERQGAGSARRRRRRRAAAPEARPGLPLLERRRDRDAGRRHAGQLSDGRRTTASSSMRPSRRSGSRCPASCSDA